MPTSKDQTESAPQLNIVEAVEQISHAHFENNRDKIALRILQVLGAPNARRKTEHLVFATKMVQKEI